MMRRGRLRATRDHLDVIRRAINIAEAEDWLGLPYRVDIANKLSQAAYTRTRDGLKRRRAAMFTGNWQRTQRGA